MTKFRKENILEKYFINAKDTLSEWESDIVKAEGHLARLTEGDKNESVYQAFRDVVFFACASQDDVNATAKTYGEKWEAVRPRAKTNPYRHPIDFVIARAGVQREEIKGSDTLCRWAKIAEAVHPLIANATITYENFIDAICNRRGGIRGYYDWLTRRKVKGKGKGISSADADKLKVNQSGETTAADSTERCLVAIVFDITNSKTYPNLTTVKSRFSPKDIREILLIQAIDETVFDLMEEGGEADA